MRFRRCELEAKAWRQYVSQWGNGGVPKQRDVEAFMRDTESNLELRQKVLGELRERAHGQASLQLGIVSAGLAVFAIFIGLTPAPSTWIEQGVSVQEISTRYGQLIGCVLAVFVIGLTTAVFHQQRARHATSYLAAYQEALAAGPTSKSRPAKASMCCTCRSDHQDCDRRTRRARWFIAFG